MADIRIVSRDYVETMGIPLLSGRGFAESDGPGGPRVMLINEALARRDFPNRSPVGETVFVNYFPQPWQIVGVIADVRQFGLAIDPQPQFFVDMRQWTDVDVLVFPAGAYYAVRAAGGGESIVPSVRTIVQQMDPQASLFYVAPMEQVVASTDLASAVLRRAPRHLLPHRPRPGRYRHLRRDGLLGRATHARDRYSRGARRAPCAGDRRLS